MILHEEVMLVQRTKIENTLF